MFRRRRLRSTSKGIVELSTPRPTPKAAKLASAKLTPTTTVTASPKSTPQPSTSGTIARSISSVPKSNTPADSLAPPPATPKPTSPTNLPTTLTAGPAPSVNPATFVDRPLEPNSSTERRPCKGNGGLDSRAAGRSVSSIASGMRVTDGDSARWPASGRRKHDVNRI